MSNYLLIKDQVGRARQLAHDLPAAGHSYGRAYRHDAHNAKDLLNEWNMHVNSPSEMQKRDYKKMNRVAI